MLVQIAEGHIIPWSRIQMQAGSRACSNSSIGEQKVPASVGMGAELGVRAANDGLMGNQEKVGLQVPDQNGSGSTRCYLHLWKWIQGDQSPRIGHRARGVPGPCDHEDLRRRDGATKSLQSLCQGHQCPRRWIGAIEDISHQEDQIRLQADDFLYRTLESDRDVGFPNVPPPLGPVVGPMAQMQIGEMGE
jgi:hypothetical protein